MKVDELAAQVQVGGAGAVEVQPAQPRLRRQRRQQTLLERPVDQLDHDLLRLVGDRGGQEDLPFLRAERLAVDLLEEQGHLAAVLLRGEGGGLHRRGRRGRGGGRGWRDGGRRGGGWRALAAWLRGPFRFGGDPRLGRPAGLPAGAHHQGGDEQGGADGSHGAENDRLPLHRERAWTYLSWNFLTLSKMAPDSLSLKAASLRRLSSSGLVMNATSMRTAGKIGRAHV